MVERDSQLEGGKPLRERGEDGLESDAGQACADAEAGTVPEGQVWVGSAGDVEPVRVGKAAGSRFAPTLVTSTASPVRIFTPAMSMSSWA